MAGGAGISFFPVSVDIFADDKFYDIQEEYGPLGEIIYIRLLCLIYRSGYYYEFSSLDKLAAAVARSIGNKWAKKSVVVQVILELVESDLFDKDLFRVMVLTSAGIQRRYAEATKRRRPNKDKKYWLLDEALFDVRKNRKSVIKSSENVDENRENADNFAQSKLNQSKLNSSSLRVRAGAGETVQEKENEIDDLCTRWWIFTKQHPGPSVRKALADCLAVYGQAPCIHGLTEYMALCAEGKGKQNLYGYMKFLDEKK